MAKIPAAGYQHHWNAFFQFTSFFEIYKMEAFARQLKSIESNGSTTNPTSPKRIVVRLGKSNASPSPSKLTKIDMTMPKMRRIA